MSAWVMEELDDELIKEHRAIKVGEMARLFYVLQPGCGELASFYCPIKASAVYHSPRAAQRAELTAVMAS